MKNSKLYIKLAVFIVLITAAYILFSHSSVERYFAGLDHLSYLGVFIGGFLFAFGFTVPFAIGLFLSLQPDMIWLATIIGGIGSVIGDIIIFLVVRHSLRPDLKKLQSAKLIKKTATSIDNHTSGKTREYLLYILAGIIIVLPIPDEIGLSILAAFTDIRMLPLCVVSFVLHGIGIFILLLA